MANRCAIRQRPQPKREVPSQPTPARSSGSCSPWHLPSRLQLAVPAFSAVQQLQPRDRRGAGHLVLCSPPSLSPSHPYPPCHPCTWERTCGHVLPSRTCCTALEPCVSGTCIAAHISHSLPSSFDASDYQRADRDAQPARSPKLQDSERSRAQDCFSMQMAGSSPC